MSGFWGILALVLEFEQYALYHTEPSAQSNNFELWKHWIGVRDIIENTAAKSHIYTEVS